MDWSVKPCPQGDAAALAEALELSETTARVLVRRGYSDAEQARAFLEVGRRELEAVAEELDDEVVSRPVVRGEHRDQGI